MRLGELVVVVPHSGILIPSEVSFDRLSPEFPRLLRNVDWYTNWLYDFRDLLDNQHLEFPYCPLILEANRHPDTPDECVPLVDVYGEPIYAAGRAPSDDLRKHLIEKYLHAFHRSVERAILAGAEFLLDAHSTLPARGVAEDQIELMNFQNSPRDRELRQFSPNAFVEIYSEELRRRLPDVQVTVNASGYHDVYGHICAEHSVNAFKRVGRQVPAILQETSQRLYVHPDGTPDPKAIDRLRRAFAESLHATLKTVRSMTRAERILDVAHGARQTFDFDCGPKALQSLMAYYGVHVREDRLIKALGTTEEGTSVDAMIRFAESRKFQVQAGVGWTFDDVKRHVDAGNPVLVCIQAWSERCLTNREWAKNYEDGHYAIVIGYNPKAVFFEDPSSFHRTWLRKAEFLARWHDRDPVSGRNLEHFGMVLLGRKPVGKRLEHME